MKLKKFFSAFTLTELLIALAILGALAAMTIPSLMEGLQKKQLIVLLKNTVGQIEQLAHNQMIAKNSKDLTLTDFVNPDKLLVEKNFPITKSCKKTEDCWSESYRVIDGLKPFSRVLEDNPKSVILKNGAIISYYYYETSSFPVLPDGDKVIGIFHVDVNGTEKPNMLGRDVFWFHISKYGKIMDNQQAWGVNEPESKLTAGCKNGTFVTACYSIVTQNNWDMPF